MEKVKSWMTEILLDVTNAEVESVADEVYRRERTKSVKGWI